MTLAELNRAPRANAERALLACGSSARWAAALVERRPFASVNDVLAASDEAWRDLGADDWREAISRHPALGARSASDDARVRAWSADEQAGVQRANGETLRQLAQAGNEYVNRFGHIFLVCASGQPAAALLEMLRQRLHNPPDVELRVAAEELRKITRLRLEKLLGKSETTEQ